MSIVAEPFHYDLTHGQRPQILLLGNGLEMCSNQKSWAELLRIITHPHSIAAPLLNKEPPEEATEDEKAAFLKRKNEFDKLPFPLQYTLLSSSSPTKFPRPQAERNWERNKLREAVSQLNCKANDLLKKLPDLQADHILTTNYSYCTDDGLDFDFTTDKKRYRYFRRTVSRRETSYRLHTCYQDPNTKGTAVWHIHGEVASLGSIVLGHDRYGRLSSEIVADLKPGVDLSGPMATLESWAQLFLYGDVYILGCSFTPSEFDLWWLLQRKQNETKASGQVYFYEISPQGGFEKSIDPRIHLLRAVGVHLEHLEFFCDDPKEHISMFAKFYDAALLDIKNKIAAKRQDMELHIETIIDNK